jgi:hypothetical protein
VSQDPYSTSSHSFLREEGYNIRTWDYNYERHSTGINIQLTIGKVLSSPSSRAPISVPPFLWFYYVVKYGHTWVQLACGWHGGANWFTLSPCSERTYLFHFLLMVRMFTDAYTVNPTGTVRIGFTNSGLGRWLRLGISGHLHIQITTE